MTDDRREDGTKADRKRRPPENWYRDVWLFVLTLLLYQALTGVAGSVDRIDQSRHDVAFENCLSQNDRHNRTIDKLDNLVAKIKDPQEKARAKLNRAGTVALIDALAPYHKDCRAYVDQLLEAPRSF